MSRLYQYLFAVLLCLLACVVAENPEPLLPDTITISDCQDPTSPLGHRLPTTDDNSILLGDQHNSPRVDLAEISSPFADRTHAPTASLTHSPNPPIRMIEKAATTLQSLNASSIIARSRFPGPCFLNTNLSHSLLTRAPPRRAPPDSDFPNGPDFDNFPTDDHLFLAKFALKEAWQLAHAGFNNVYKENSNPSKPERSATFLRYFTRKDDCRVSNVLKTIRGAQDRGPAQMKPALAGFQGFAVYYGSSSPDPGVPNLCATTTGRALLGFLVPFSPAYPIGVIVLCPDFFAKYQRPLSDMTCPELKDRANEDFVTLSGVVLHEFTHWNYVIQTATRAKIIDYNWVSGASAPTVPNTDPGDGYGPWSAFRLAELMKDKDKKAQNPEKDPTLNADNYAWYCFESYWHYRCPDHSFSDPIPADNVGMGQQPPRPRDELLGVGPAPERAPPSDQHVRMVQDSAASTDDSKISDLIESLVQRVPSPAPQDPDFLNSPVSDPFSTPSESQEADPDSYFKQSPGPEHAPDTPRSLHVRKLHGSAPPQEDRENSTKLNMIEVIASHPMLDRNLVDRDKRFPNGPTFVNFPNANLLEAAKFGLIECWTLIQAGIWNLYENGPKPDLSDAFLRYFTPPDQCPVMTALKTILGPEGKGPLMMGDLEHPFLVFYGNNHLAGAEINVCNKPLSDGDSVGAYFTESTQYPGGVMVICPTLFEKYSTHLAQIDCNQVGATADTFGQSISSVMLHEFFHWHTVIGRAVGHYITDFNIAEDGSLIDPTATPIDGYGPYHAFQLAKLQKAPALNADNYEWYCLESYLKYKCGSSFKDPIPPGNGAPIRDLVVDAAALGFPPEIAAADTAPSLPELHDRMVQNTKGFGTRMEDIL